MSTQTTPGISRRTWRTAVIVFLVVLLGGSGISGAYALWSQQATVTATVKTGFWVQPGFELPIAMTATRRSGDDDWEYRGVNLNWAPAQPAPAGVEVRYVVEGKGLETWPTNRIEAGTLPYEGIDTSRGIRVTRPYVFSERFQITVTPYINGIAGKPTTQVFRLTPGGSIQ